LLLRHERRPDRALVGGQPPGEPEEHRPPHDRDVPDVVEHREVGRQVIEMVEDPQQLP
jgi:hypothetical protein